MTRLHLAWKDTPTRANRALALLSHMYTMAERWGLRPTGFNPCRHVPRNREVHRERFLAPDELARVAESLVALEANSCLTPFGLAAIRLLIFTGARASEILSMRWDAVAETNGVARLADSKTGAKTIFLNPPALDVLTHLPRVDGNPHVIPGAVAGSRLTLYGLEQVWQRVRDAAQRPDVRLHDLRHSFASVAASSGHSLPMIGGLLGHTQPRTTQRYAHLAAHPLRMASDSVELQIAEVMKKTPR